MPNIDSLKGSIWRSNHAKFKKNTFIELFCFLVFLIIVRIFVTYCRVKMH